MTIISYLVVLSILFIEKLPYMTIFSIHVRPLRTQSQKRGNSKLLNAIHYYIL